ncbi:hypothetical protein [Lusitaniella coriacea]|uniref:hypothetical protein n=1 Tax=Lusitaniella coriacea TaxID=1983105 RepID=UPI003CE8D44B
MTFTPLDPRAMSAPVYEALSKLRQPYDREWQQLEAAKAKTQNKAKLEGKQKLYSSHLKEQKNQAVELYTYLATWGLMRFKAEEIALDKTKLGKSPPTSLEQKAKTSQYGKRETIAAYFSCLEQLAENQSIQGVARANGLEVLKCLNAEEYLGLSGLALRLAQEFAFWANAIYHDISGGE